MGNRLYLKVCKNKIATLIRIFEGYDNVGLVTTITINPQERLVAIQMTPDTKAIVLQILTELPFVETVDC